MIPVDVSVDGSARARWPMRDGRRRATAARVLFERNPHARRPQDQHLLVEAAAEASEPATPPRGRGVWCWGENGGDVARDARAAQQSVSMARA